MGFLSPQPFCTICFRYMSPASARRHTKHARAIINKPVKK